MRATRPAPALAQDAVVGEDEDMDLRRVYTIMYRICKLKRA